MVHLATSALPAGTGSGVASGGTGKPAGRSEDSGEVSGEASSRLVPPGAGVKVDAAPEG